LLFPPLPPPAPLVLLLLVPLAIEDGRFNNASAGGPEISSKILYQLRSLHYDYDYIHARLGDASAVCT
jgi:hypothetical protein